MCLSVCVCFSCFCVHLQDGSGTESTAEVADGYRAPSRVVTENDQTPIEPESESTQRVIHPSIHSSYLVSHTHSHDNFTISNYLTACLWNVGGKHVGVPSGVPHRNGKNIKTPHRKPLIALQGFWGLTTKPILCPRVQV